MIESKVMIKTSNEWCKQSLTFSLGIIRIIFLAPNLTLKFPTRCQSKQSIDALLFLFGKWPTEISILATSI